jgi:formate-dependent nitrite reductase cytochrome c552 subunit
VSHHFHEVGSEAAQCTSCHMPARNFMIVDPRRDHSFRVPRPDISAKLGTPSVCTKCHTSQSFEWATNQIASHRSQTRAGEPYVAESVGRAPPIVGASIRRRV